MSHKTYLFDIDSDDELDSSNEEDFNVELHNIASNRLLD